MKQAFGELLQAVAKKRKATEKRNKATYNYIGDVPYNDLVNYSKKELENGTPLKYIVDTIHYQTKQTMKYNETKGGK